MENLLETLAKPILRRIGSAIAGTAITLGATTEQVGTIEAALVALVGVGIDLWLSNRDAKKKTRDALMQ